MADEEIEFCECTCACCSGCTGRLVTWHPVPDSMASKDDSDDH